MTRTLRLGLCIAMIGCSGRMIGGDDAGRLEDAGPARDAGRDPDAGPEPDAGRDAGRDAGPPPPVCDCPEYPATCTPPTANEPAFTPDADASLGQLFDLIACADTTLRIAMYEGDWPCVTAAIQTRLDDDPDLVVEIITDGERCPSGACIFDALDLSDRVTVVRDARSAFMHHKLAIADSTRVWVSSGNFSERSFCEDHNNSIVIDDAAIVARYEAVFDRMFTGMMFGPVDPPEGETVSGNYSVWFSPERRTMMSPALWFTAIIAAIDAATTSIDVMINAWTRTEISDALIAADARGVAVQVLVAHTYANDAPAQAILAAGIPIRRSEIHDKVLVVDDMLAITGSPNWSENAWDNNENSLWIRDAAVATAYSAEIDRVFEIGRTVDPVP